MLTKDNKGLFINKNKNENIELHSECIIKINDFHDELLKEKTNYITLEYRYNILYESHKELEKKFNIIEKENDELKLSNKELFKKLDKYEKYENGIKDQYDNIVNNLNSTILKLNEDIDILNSNKNKDVENIKEQNKLLIIDNERIKKQLFEIQNKEITNKNDNDILLENSKNEIIDSITKDIELKYSNNFKSLNKTIEDFKIEIRHKDDIINNLNIKINSLENKSDKNKTVKKENKYNKEYLYKGFSILDDDDIKWKKIAGTFTYKKFKLLYNFNDAIENDKNINQDTYNEVIEYLNEKAVYNGDGKIKKISLYYKNKLKRVSELYNIFGKKLININIKTSFITSLNKDQFELFINILNDEIDKRNLILNDISSDSEESIKTYYNNNNESIKNSKDNCKYDLCNSYNSCKCIIKI